MIALLLALSLAPAAPVAAPLPPSPEPAPVVVTAQPTPTPLTPDAKIAQLQALFDQSCGQRAYATYDDLCEALGDQVKTAQREIEQAKHKRPSVTVTPVTNP